MAALLPLAVEGGSWFLTTLAAAGVGAVAEWSVKGLTDDGKKVSLGTVCEKIEGLAKKADDTQRDIDALTQLAAETHSQTAENRLHLEALKRRLKENSEELSKFAKGMDASLQGIRGQVKDVRNDVATVGHRLESQINLLQHKTLEGQAKQAVLTAQRQVMAFFRELEHQIAVTAKKLERDGDAMKSGAYKGLNQFVTRLRDPIGGIANVLDNYQSALLLPHSSDGLISAFSRVCWDKYESAEDAHLKYGLAKLRNELIEFYRNIANVQAVAIFILHCISPDEDDLNFRLESVTPPLRSQADKLLERFPPCIDFSSDGKYDEPLIRSDRSANRRRGPPDVASLLQTNSNTFIMSQRPTHYTPVEKGVDGDAPPSPGVVEMSRINVPQLFAENYNQQALFWQIRRSVTAEGFYNLVAFRKEQFEPVVMTWDGDDYSVDWKGRPVELKLIVMQADRSPNKASASALIRLVDKDYKDKNLTRLHCMFAPPSPDNRLAGPRIEVRDIDVRKTRALEMEFWQKETEGGTKFSPTYLCTKVIRPTFTL